MRYSIIKKNSTKAERRFYEILKELHIPFKHRWLIKSREIDFIIGKYAIEIEEHLQDPLKNHCLVEEGFIPIHFTNDEIINNYNYIKQWLEQISLQKEQIQTETKNT